MAANVAVTYTYVNGTAADGTQVNQNFTDIVNWINTNAVHLDGAKPFTGAPSYAADPVSANQLCRKSYVDGYIGGVLMSTLKLRRAAVLSIPSTAITDITWDTEDSDAAGFIAVPTTTLTVPAGHGGIYVINIVLNWASAPGNVSLSGYLNGTANIYLQAANTAGTVTRSTAWFYLNAGDTVKYSAQQLTGSAINMTGSLTMKRISD